MAPHWVGNVSAHVEHILAKLEVARRAVTATWVAKVALPEAPTANERAEAAAIPR